MCGGNDHLAWKHPISLEACRGLLWIHLRGLELEAGGYNQPRLKDRLARPCLEIAQMTLRRHHILHSVTPIQTSEDAHARMDRLEQRMRQMRVSDGAISWDDFDGALVASLPAQFKMPEIERYTGIGCPKIHLRLYSSVMRAHGLDEAHLIMLFPMSLSGAYDSYIPTSDPRACFSHGLKETSYLILSAPSSIDCYSSCIEADTIVLSLVPPPPSGIHHIDFVEDDSIHMMSWDDGLPKPIVLDDGYEVDIVGSQTSTPFSLISDWVPFELTPTAPSATVRRGPSIPFILRSDGDDLEGRDV
ncbi:hypothetical protein AAG906_035872 [Vitis piasezkii]